jgi:hypothetical protein
MNIDPGLVVIIVAVLAFYLRMILLQRSRAKRAAAYQSKPAGKNVGKRPNKRPGKPPARLPAPDYSIISQDKRDWIIAGAGILLVLIGVLLNLKAIPIPLAQNYWWLPVAIGIVAFSWGFK